MYINLDNTTKKAPREGAIGGELEKIFIIKEKCHENTQ
jgi:hypothetical protein